MKTGAIENDKVGDIDDLVQDCSISIAYAPEILQSCTKPSICNIVIDLACAHCSSFHIQQKQPYYQPFMK